MLLGDVGDVGDWSIGLHGPATRRLTPTRTAELQAETDG